MRQCIVKLAWIGHALKRRPYWERQTRLIPSVFYIISFHAFLKRKTVKRTLLQRDNIFSPKIKKHPALRGHKNFRNFRGKENLIGHFCQFSQKETSFLHFKTTNFLFDFNLQFWRSATLLIRTLYLLFQVALCNQPTIVFAPLKAISTFKPYCTPYELLVSVLWLTLSFGEVSKDLPENALKI